MTKLYWAYGSNLNYEQMRRRCPGAEPFAPLVVPNSVLRFRNVADVAYLAGAECHGGLWEITAEDEASLDHYEGFDAKHPTWGLYSKRYLEIQVDGRRRTALYYIMNEVGIMPPSRAYLDAITQGYRDFGLDLDRLQRAVDHAWNRRRKTPYLRDRWKRKGAPRLAREVRREAIPAERF